MAQRQSQPEDLRPPLYSKEAEQAVLGAVLCDNVLVGRVAGLLAPEDFGNAVHGRIWTSVTRAVGDGADANPVTLKAIFDHDEALKQIGGGAYLGRLAKEGALVNHPEDYADIVVEFAARRELIAAAQDAVDQAEAGLNSSADIATNLEKSLVRLRRETLDRLDRDHQLKCTAAEPHRISDIPPRPWAYGNFLLFGHASAIGAVDGGGKGAMAVAIAASMITGHPLLNERVWRTGPVAVLTYEDDEIEWRRRIAAACLHYGLDYEAVIGNFYFITRPDRRVSLAGRGPKDGVLFPDGDDIIRSLKQIGAIMFIVDPFNHAHHLEDGNNNALIAQVAGEVTRIARESGTAVLVLHHLRKGSAGNPDDLMGATSLRATFRSCRILARMTAKEAQDLNLPARQAWRYSRIAGSKENYAPPPELASWYRLESIALGNADDRYPDGDNLQVTTVWTPPSAFKGITLPAIADIFAELRKEPAGASGEFYSPDRRSKRWAGKIIVEKTGKSEGDAERVMRGWLDTKVLMKDKYDSPERREEVTRVTLNETKVAEVLGPLYCKPDADE